MPAEVRMEIDVSGWMRKNERLMSAIGKLSKAHARLEYVGTHSDLHVANSRIALAEFDRAGRDKNAIFPLDAGDKKKPANLLARALKAIAEGHRPESAIDALKVAIESLRKAVTKNVLADKTTGPARTPEWNAYKAAHYRPPTPKMVASREWLKSLRASVNGAAAGRRAG